MKENVVKDFVLHHVLFRIKRKGILEMKRLSEVQSELMKLRKLYKESIRKEDAQTSEKLSIKIHTLEWVLEIQSKL